MLKEKKFNILSTFTKQVDEDKGIAYVSGWASKAYENGQLVIDRDDEHVDTVGFELGGAKVLLAQHDWDRPVGKLALSHRPEGIWLDGEVHRAMDEKMYYAVKNGIIDSFSIGFTVSDYDYIKDRDGNDILSFTKGSVHEVSLVSIPSNIKATISSVKSLVKEGKCTGMECSIETLKSMNPDCECELNKTKGLTVGTKEQIKNLADKIKGLTIEETEGSEWRLFDEFSRLVSLFRETVLDNVDEHLYYENITVEEMKDNIQLVMAEFLTRFETIASKLETIEGETMSKSLHKKSSEEEEVEVTPNEGDIENPDEDLGDNAPEGETETSSEETSTEIEETPQEEEIEEVIAEPVQPTMTLEAVIGYLSTLDIGELTETQVEALYNVTGYRIDAMMEEAFSNQDEEN